ncbi:unnamed protein product [Phaeothamnion confervicola]
MVSPRMRSSASLVCSFDVGFLRPSFHIFHMRSSALVRSFFTSVYSILFYIGLFDPFLYYAPQAIYVGTTAPAPGPAFAGGFMGSLFRPRLLGFGPLGLRPFGIGGWGAVGGMGPAMGGGGMGGGRHHHHHLRHFRGGGGGGGGGGGRHISRAFGGTQNR